MRLAFIAFLMVVFEGPALGEVGPTSGESLGEFVERLRSDARIPGVAVAIVRDGELVLAEGFGYRDLDRRLPVTTETQFAIGSTTKAITATAIGLLATEGRLAWDQPVQEYLPDFRLKDPVASRFATIVDLLSHVTGVARHDLAWYGNDSASRADLFSILPYLDPSASFRERWQYNNFMYLAAGVAIERLSGRTWEEFVRERIFSPLSMNVSHFSVEELARSELGARPYSLRAGPDPVRIPYRPIVGMGPAGSIVSNIHDLARWLIANMDRGRIGENQEIPEAVLAAVHRPRAILPPGRVEFAEFSSATYALGWIVQHYRGQKWIWHNGGIDGFLAHVGFMPDRRVGVIVLQNGDWADLGLPIALRAYDEILRLEPIDWVKRFSETRTRTEPVVSVSNSSPMVRPVADYVGVYRHRAYGPIEVWGDGHTLKIRFRGMAGELDHLRGGVFHARFKEWEPLPLPPLYFQINASGEIREIHWQLEGAVEPIRFRR